jgi:DNA-binding YbaB/EbfC family protein
MKGGLGGLIKQAQVMKLKVEQTQARLAQESFSAQTGDPEAGGEVRVSVSGRQQILSVSIDPGLLADGPMLEDLLLAALNKALEESRARHEKEMGALTGGLNLPFGF